jgi:5-methylcytosine-specific restriction endonuclease McrA
VNSLDKEIIRKYKLPLNDAFDYIEKKKPVSKRKQWTQNQRQKWMLREPNCPICKEVWSKSNPMTKEHIHPIVLGGQDRDDNHVPLCEKCNQARNEVMVAVLGSSNILAIRNRMPALKTSIEEFVIWCYATINKDYGALEYCHHLTQSFLKIRKITNPYVMKEMDEIKNTKDSLFVRIKRPFQSLARKIKGTLNEGNKKETPEQIPISPKRQKGVKKDSTKGILSKSPQQIMAKQKKIEVVKFDHNQWLIDNWKGKSSYPLLREAVTNFENQKEHPRKFRDVAKEDFGIPKRWDVKQIAKKMNELKEELEKGKDSNQPPSSPPNSKQEEAGGADLVPNPDNEILTYLRNSISKRIPTKTYKSGFSASQLGYIFKQAKEHLEVSWNELFSSFDVTGSTIQEKSISVVSQLGFTLEEEIGSDEILRYKITEKIKDKSTQKRPPTTKGKSASKTKFPLVQWLNENWKGSQSYTKLCAEILAHEQNSGGNRKATDVLKKDFGIPKSISKEKKVARIEKMISLNKTLNPADFKEIITSILGHDEVSMSKLAEELRKAAVARGAPDSTTGKMLKEFGFDGKIKTVLEDLFGNELVIGNDSSNLKVKLRVAKKNEILVENDGSFPLHSWLESNWEGKASYPSLRKAITEFESKKGNPRKFRDVVKQDFDIPKGWNVKRIVKRMNELKLSSDL